MVGGGGGRVRGGTEFGEWKRWLLGGWICV